MQAVCRSAIARNLARFLAASNSCADFCRAWLRGLNGFSVHGVGTIRANALQAHRLCAWITCGKVGDTLVDESRFNCFSHSLSTVSPPSLHRFLTRYPPRFGVRRASYKPLWCWPDDYHVLFSCCP